MTATGPPTTTGCPRLPIGELRLDPQGATKDLEVQVDQPNQKISSATPHRSAPDRS
jgi:hypothetical protein